MCIAQYVICRIAQACAVRGDKPSALRALRTSVESGFFSYPYLAKDPLLSALRSEPEFAQTLNMTRQRYEAFRSSLIS